MNDATLFDAPAADSETAETAKPNGKAHDVAPAIGKLPAGVETTASHDAVDQHPPDGAENFKWGAENWRENSGDVIVAEQRAIAVYSNPYSQLVLRQERSAFDDEDVCIVISPEYVALVIKKMQAELAELEDMRRGRK